MYLFYNFGTITKIHHSSYRQCEKDVYHEFSIETFHVLSSSSIQQNTFESSIKSIKSS